MRPFSVKCDFLNGVCIVCGSYHEVSGMPSDVVGVVSTSVGVSVLAGILSGVVYILAQGFGKKRIRKRELEWYCEICGSYFKTEVDSLETQVVTCSKCGTKVCKEKCSQYVRRRSKWLCRPCLKPPDSWFRGILKAIQPFGKGLFDSAMSSQSVPEIDEELESLRKLEKEQVREFIEKLVNVMLGENVDNASVSKLFTDDTYLPISGQSPCTAHAALKRLIEKLLQDAVSLPQLQQEQQQPPAQIEDRNRTYENLLATAIINKVISSCQSNLPTSSANSESSRLSTSSHPRENKEYFFGEETLDSKWKTTDLDTTSVSSLEEWMQSECSTGSKKYVDRVTLMIKQDIEEVDQSDSEPEDMDVDYLTPNTTLVNDSDTNNWFLQKRHFQSTHSPVPVPMLVPNPTTEAKVFIGDKPVDDTSDLSDVGSDYEEPEPVPKTHTLLIKSKTLIGGLNAEHSENGDEYSESSTDSGVKEVNEKEEGRRFELMNGSPQLRADITVDDDNLEDSSFLSVYSNTEKEAEYTERYSSLPRTILKTPTPPLRPSRKIDNKLGSRSPVEAEKDNLLNRTSPESEFGGIYSKKEKEKWKYAVEMKNNPYSKENIEKRLRMSSSSVSSLFGSDYYARQAKSPSGGKVKSPEVSLENHVSHLEEMSTYSSLPRSLYTPKDSSKHFVKNPLLNFPESEGLL